MRGPRSAVAGAAVFALLSAGSQAARAQLVLGSALQTYTLDGCFDGPLSRRADLSLVRGPVGCLGGTAQLFRLTTPPGVVPQYLFAGTLTAQFTPELTAQTAAVDPLGSSVFISGGSGPPGYFEFTPGNIPFFSVSNPGPVPFRTRAAPFP